MSAEILRRAAALMRERAEDAVLASGNDAWKADGLAWNDNRGTVHMVGAGPVNVCDAITEEQAEHIASWHPIVALAVADWLERVAYLLEHGSVSPGEPSSALAVARAFLGEAS